MDVIDISNPSSPFLSSQNVYGDTDITKVAVHNNVLYATGATSSGNEGAILHKVTLDGAGDITPTYASVHLRSAGSETVSAYSGTSVLASGNSVYALSGNNGGLHILNASDLSVTAFTAIEEARDLSLAGSSLYVVTGKTASDEARVKLFSSATGAVQSTFNVGLTNAQIDGGKSTLYTGSTAQLATAGFGGTRLICISSAATLSTIVNPTLAGLTSDEQAANAVTFGNGLIYVANGGAGVSIYAITRALLTSGCDGLSVNYLGRFTFGDYASANNVRYSNGYLVVATGSAGFKIVRVNQSVLLNLLLSL